MQLSTERLIEYIFFFSVFGVSAYLVWKLFAPFMGTLALAAIIVTLCYPMYEYILKQTPKKNETVAALISILIIVLVIVIPLTVLASFILREALAIYALFGSADSIGFLDSVARFETAVQSFIPGFSFDTANAVQQVASFIANHIVSIFAGTARTFFLTFITLIAAFYFFKDGKYFTMYLVKLSPLKDANDALVLKRLAVAIRSVMMGTVFVAIVQGFLTFIGLSILGFNHAILWGSVAAIGALVPAVGTSIVLIPAIIYLFITGENISAIILIGWAVLAVGLIDNLLGPYVMSRGNKLHPFLVLMSVLGGISAFGPIGFILGPVIVSLFFVLLELYHSYFKRKET